MIELQKFNQLTMKNSIKKCNPCHDLPKSCGGGNLDVQFVYSPQKICNHTQVQVSGSINYDTVNKNTHVKNQQSNYWTVNLKGILYQQKQLIGVNNDAHPTVSLTTNLLKPMGEENTYVRFVYDPQTIFNHTQG